VAGLAFRFALLFVVLVVAARQRRVFDLTARLVCRGS
jgi:hypothetical protein